MYLFKAFLTALFSILALFILVKLVGNKQVSQMNMFDYVNGISIGSIAAELAVADELREFLIVLVAMATYTVVAFLISILTIKSIKLRRILTGRSLILIENGVIYKKNLAKCKLDINEVLTLARNQGYFYLTDIEYAIMENNGKISFLQKADARPVTISDMSINSSGNDGLVSNVIIDGKLMPQNLRHMGKDAVWLDEQIKKQGYKDYSEIILATLDSNFDLSIYRAIEQENMTNLFD